MILGKKTYEQAKNKVRLVLNKVSRLAVLEIIRTKHQNSHGCLQNMVC